MCSTCGAMWTQNDLAGYPALHFVTSPPLNEFQENTLNEVILAGAALMSCPKCYKWIDSRLPDQVDLRRQGLNEAMYRGDDRNTAGDEDQPAPSDEEGTIHRQGPR